MSDYRKLVEKALLNAKKDSKPKINEAFKYSGEHQEKMHPELEKDLKDGKHSLGKHPAFPSGDEHSFEEKIMAARFDDVVSRYKRVHDTDDINNQDVIMKMMPMVNDVMKIEQKHRKELEDLAIKMVREEYNISEDAVEIIAELTEKIDMSGTKKNPTPITNENIQFESHQDMLNASDEVYKRRFANAMIQGAAKKCNHMFHMVDDELEKIHPSLPTKYSKMMSAADYMYYVIPKMENGINGGVVRVQFPTEENPKAVIYAQAMVFPVLIHELIKGVMELLSGHGLPEDEQLSEYVIDKSDFLAAEPWDMRLGPALWERFTMMINPEDFNLKHHIYTELMSLPVSEFNDKMREIMAGTKRGKQIIVDITNEIKEDLDKDDYRIAMMEADKEMFFSNPDELDNIDLEGLF